LGTDIIQCEQDQFESTSDKGVFHCKTSLLDGYIDDIDGCCHEHLEFSGVVLLNQVLYLMHLPRHYKIFEQRRRKYFATKETPILFFSNCHSSAFVQPNLRRDSSPLVLLQSLDILLPDRDLIDLPAPVQGGPLGLVLEQTHGLDKVVLIDGEAVIDAGGQDDEVALLDAEADPLVVARAHIKVAGAVEDVPDLLVLVQVLVEEHVDLALVGVAERLRRDLDGVAVLVAALLCEDVHARHVGVVRRHDANVCEHGRRDRLGGIMGLARISLESRRVGFGSVYGVLFFFAVDGYPDSLAAMSARGNGGAGPYLGVVKIISLHLEK
jgi:hypothetical protein